MRPLTRLYYTPVGSLAPGRPARRLSKASRLMISVFRDFVKSWAATALLGLLIIAFAFLGIYNGNSGSMRGAVVSAGSRSVSDAAFKKQFESYLQELGRPQNRTLSLEEAVAGGVDKKVLEEMGQIEAFSEIITRAGIRPSDKLIRDQIAQAPIFLDPVTRTFSQAAYTAKINELGYSTPKDFEAFLRDDIARRHTLLALTTGLKMPRTYVALGATRVTEIRDASYVAIPNTSVQPPPPPTDAQLAAFRRDHDAALRRPELRVISVVRFSAAAIAPTLTPDPAAVAARWERIKDTFATAATRTLVQVPCQDAARCAQVATRVKAGEDPSAVARSIGVEAIVYDAKPQSAITDRKVGAAAFAMPAGTVSAPLQGDVGMAVIKVTAATAGVAPDFNAHRAEIENKIRAEQAEKLVYEQSQKYDAARAQGDNLLAAAAKAGITAVTIGPLAANGANLEGTPPNPILTLEILETAFKGLSQGQESEVIEAPGVRGEAYAVRVERVLPPQTPPLEEIRAQLIQGYVIENMKAALEAKINAISARIKAGETLEAIAASVGGRVAHIVGATMQTVQTDQNMRTVLGDFFLNALFAAKPADVFTAPIQGGVAAVKVASIRPGDPAMSAQIIEAQRQQVTQQLFGDLVQGMLQSSKSYVKVRTDLKRARTILGIDDSMLPAAERETAAPAAKATPAPVPAK